MYGRRQKMLPYEQKKMSSSPLAPYPVPSEDVCGPLEEENLPSEYAKCMACAVVTTEYQLQNSTKDITQDLCEEKAENAKKCCFHDHFPLG